MKKQKASNVLEFPAGMATLSPLRSHPKPGAVKSQAPEKKKGKVLEIVPKVISIEEVIEFCDLYTQMSNAMKKFLEKDRWIGVALLAGATVEGNNEQTEWIRKHSLTYTKSNPREDILRGLKLKILSSVC